MKKSINLGSILFWITLISPIVSFSLASLIGEANIFGVAGIIRYSWVMLLFIPVGILSILIGIKLKKENQNYKKNFIVAFICLPLILIFGSYRFIFGDYISYDVETVYAIETKTNLNLPDRIKVATNELDSYTVSYVKITSEEEITSFEHELLTSPFWNEDLKPEIKRLLPVEVQLEIANFDYFVFYNLTTNEYNKYPSEGCYECLFIAYDHQSQRLIIIDDLRINKTSD